MGNTCCGPQTFEKGTLDLEVFKFQEMLSKKPDLKKYQHKLSDKQNNLQNMAECLRSNIYGQSVLGTKNPLKE